MDTYMGIELGSTRVKAAIVNGSGVVVGSGIAPWASKTVDGHWTYSLDDAWGRVQEAFREAVANAPDTSNLKGIGVSGMMHGYLPFDARGELLVPFRTWKNTSTGKAASILVDLFNFNIPLRWSVAHLVQAALDGEPHVSQVAFMTTLAGYIHWRLTDRHVLGVGDASGMFPIDSSTRTYDAAMMDKARELLTEKGVSLDLWEVFPRVLSAGEDAGRLSEAGALLLDPSGETSAGIPLCAPEGDAGTGMVATNSVKPRTGNVSVGTSVFAMVVLQGPLQGTHAAIDVVTTPTGAPVAMVHCNNGAEELRAWVQLFQEFATLTGIEGAGDRVFELLLHSALDAPRDAAGMTVFNLAAGEPLLEVDEGQPMVLWEAGTRPSLGALFRAHVYSVFASLRIGLDVLRDEEGISIESIVGHGGVFRTPVVAQRLLAAAVAMPVLVGQGAGEGGAWGMAVLTLYSQKGGERALDEFLEEEVFGSASFTKLEPDEEDLIGFSQYLERFVSGLDLQRSVSHSEGPED